MNRKIDSRKKAKLTQGFLTLFCMAMAAVVIIYAVKAFSKPIVQEETLDEDLVQVYTGTATSPSPFGGNVTVEVTLDKEGTILEVKVVENNATEGIGTKAIDALPERIVEAQGTDVDGVASATITSEAILTAVNDALSQAGIQ